MAILLENASIVTLDAARPVLAGRQILVHEGAIAAVGRRIDAPSGSPSASTARRGSSCRAWSTPTPT